MLRVEHRSLDSPDRKPGTAGSGETPSTIASVRQVEYQILGLLKTFDEVDPLMLRGRQIVFSE